MSEVATLRRNPIQSGVDLAIDADAWQSSEDRFIEFRGERESVSDAVERVVLINDDVMDNLVHERLIKRSGLVKETVVFQYAERALEYLRTTEQHVDIIFLDVNMPRMNGFEVLTEYSRMDKSRHARTVIMLLTTSTHLEDYETARQFEAVRSFRVKPLDLDKLRSAIDEMRS